MRIGLYGMPTAGKTYILDKVDFLEVMSGSVLLREICPTFDSEDDHGKNMAPSHFHSTELVFRVLHLTCPYLAFVQTGNSDICINPGHRLLLSLRL